MSERNTHGEGFSGGMERIKNSPNVLIYVERHGRPYKPDTVPEEPDALGRVGKLSEEGEQETSAVAVKRAEAILDKGRPVTFFFFGSSSEHFIEGVPYGARGQDTAEKAAKATKDLIAERGLSPSEAQVLVFNIPKSGSRPHKALGEPDYFFVDGSENSLGYFKALVSEYGKAKTEFGHSAREEGWLSDAHGSQELESVREDVGAQNAPQVGERALRFLKSVGRYAEHYSGRNPGRDLVFILGTHGDTMRALTQHGFGVGEDARNYVYDYNEAIPIEVKNGKLFTSFKDEQYEADTSTRAS